MDAKLVIFSNSNIGLAIIRGKTPIIEGKNQGRVPARSAQMQAINFQSFLHTFSFSRSSVLHSEGQALRACSRKQFKGVPNILYVRKRILSLSLGSK